MIEAIFQGRFDNEQLVLLASASPLDAAIISLDQDPREGVGSRRIRGVTPELRGAYRPELDQSKLEAWCLSPSSQQSVNPAASKQPLSL